MKAHTKSWLDYVFCLVIHRYLMRMWWEYIGRRLDGRRVYLCAVCRRNRVG